MPAAPDACWVANDNAPGQVVIAGTPDGVEAGSARAKELGVKRATPLNVGGAFHTPLMDDAADGLAAELASVPFAHPVAPVVSNDDAAAATPTATAGAPASPEHVTRSGALAYVDGDDRRARRRPRSSKSDTAR